MSSVDNGCRSLRVFEAWASVPFHLPTLAETDISRPLLRVADGYVEVGPVLFLVLTDFVLFPLLETLLAWCRHGDDRMMRRIISIMTDN